MVYDNFTARPLLIQNTDMTILNNKLPTFQL